MTAVARVLQKLADANKEHEMRVRTKLKAGLTEGVEEMTDDHWKLVNYLR